MNIADIIEHHAHDRQKHPAIEDGHRVISYADLADRVRAAATNLQGNGIKASDWVGVMLADSAEHLVVLYALFKVGVVIATIDLDLPTIEKDQMVSRLGLKAVIKVSNGKQGCERFQSAGRRNMPPGPGQRRAV